MSVVVLTGGVGGNKLVLGLSRIVPADRLTAVVNTGDDFRHLGLWVSPDIDTMLYTLSGQSNQELGWGRAGESWSFMAALRSLGGPDWFNLGDGDLALHVMRTARLAKGDTLSTIVADFAKLWDLHLTILPMSDDPVATMVSTDMGELSFQSYFVEHRCQPKVQSIRFDGAATAQAAPGVIEAIMGAEVVLIAPSNPYLSIDPILSVPAIRQALVGCSAPVVAVSPLVGGEAVKGPTAKLMRELGIVPSAASVAAHLEGVIDGMLVDVRDGPVELALPYDQVDTLMTTLDDRMRVADASLKLADRLR